MRQSLDTPGAAPAPDWSRFVREHLPPLGLAPERELEIAEELALQLEQTWRAALAAGASEPEALVAAEREVGDWQALAAEIRRAERPVASCLPAPPEPFRGAPVPGSSRGTWGADLLQDARYALRMLGKKPGLAAVMLATLALGIGATTAIFSVVHALLLAPLPFHDADRLVLMRELSPSGNSMSVAWPNYQDWQRRTRSFSQMAAYRQVRFNATGGEVAERLEGRAVGGTFFELLGTRPQLGRLLTAADDVEGGAPVAVIGDALWHRRFGGDEAAVGKTLMLDGRPFTVVGVLPPSFRYPGPSELMVPLALTRSPGDLDRGNHRGLVAMARLGDGVTLDQARVEVVALASTLSQEHPDTNSGNGAQVLGLRESLVADVRTALVVLMGAVACVLLIACVNLANLLLARGATRGAEVAVRVALGASRRRVARQLLTESLLLALAGGALGALLARQVLPLLVDALPGNTPLLANAHLHPQVLLFALAVTVGTGLLFGLLPALQTSRSGLAGTARATARSTGNQAGSRSRSRRILLVGEVALAIVLLTTAGLMMRTVMQLVRVDPGVSTDRLLTLSFELVGERYEGESRVVAYRELIERVEALPEVESAGLTLSLPLDGSNWGSVFVIEGQPLPARADLPSSAFTPASPGYFETLDVRLLEGRLLTESDNRAANRVALVNETLAKLYWPGEKSIGQRLKQGWPEWTTPWWEVVGVVADAKLEGVEAPTPPQVYLPLAQNPVTGLFLVARTRQGPAHALAAVEGAIRGFDRDLPIYRPRTMEQVLAESIAPHRFPTVLLGSFSLAALVLAALGIFGLMSYAVAQRTHEVGLRMALGASGGRVVRQVVGEAMALVAGGVVLGVAGALLATRSLRSLLFEVSPTDPLAFSAAVLLLAAVALGAAYLPARRAARVDPMVALRCE